MDLGKEYRRMAEDDGYFRGLSMLAYADQIGELIKATGSTTILDWGCGAGDQYRKPHEVHKRWGVEKPTLFDPHFKKISGKPRKAHHGVICTDVLEHVKEGKVDELIANLFKYAERFVFATVCCRPAKKTFANGRNLHITLHPYEWWFAKFEAALLPCAPPMQFILIETP